MGRRLPLNRVQSGMDAQPRAEEGIPLQVEHPTPTPEPPADELPEAWEEAVATGAATLGGFEVAPSEARRRALRAGAAFDEAAAAAFEAGTAAFLGE